MDEVTIVAETGRETGSRPSGRIRTQDRIPGVVYGRGTDPVSISIERRALRLALTTDAGLNALINLDLDGKKQLSIVKELQRHPIRRNVTHVDFLLIDRSKPIEVEVPIVLVGEARKVNDWAGMIDHQIKTLTVKAKPDNIPNQVEVDISDLDIGTSVTVADIALPDDVVCDMDPEQPVAFGAATRGTLLLQQGGSLADLDKMDEGDVGGDGGGEGSGDAGAGDGD